MFSPAIEKQRRQLYAHTVSQMGSRLRAAGDLEAVFPALRWGMREIDRAYDESPVKLRASVACRAGCAHCCSVAVDVQAHEVFLAAEYLQLNSSPGELASLIERTAAYRRRLVAEGREARNHPWQPCALLRDGTCSIYPDRPEACRVHHASDATVCAAHAADPAIDVDAVYLRPLRARLFAVMLGMDEAVEAAGFDDRAYDFNAALHEALTNSLCRVLWLRRKPAFPDSCLAD